MEYIFKENYCILHVFVLSVLSDKPAEAVLTLASHSEQQEQIDSCKLQGLRFLTAPVYSHTEVFLHLVGIGPVLHIIITYFETP